MLIGLLIARRLKEFVVVIVNAGEFDYSMTFLQIRSSGQDLYNNYFTALVERNDKNFMLRSSNYLVV